MTTQDKINEIEQAEKALKSAIDLVREKGAVVGGRRYFESAEDNIRMATENMTCLKSILKKELQAQARRDKKTQGDG